MPPQRKKKTAKEKESEAEQKKRLLATKERILSIKRQVLSIIETLIEKDVSKEWLLANCAKLCHADYDDIVQERSIEHLCGYPLCNNTIKQTLKQKFHISAVANKVYDMTERKCFCSNQCYKASNYLKAQLSPIPLYMRKEENIKVHLLSDCDNKGTVGEEILFHHMISQNEVNEVHNKIEKDDNLQNVLNEELKKCADSLGDLHIKEHIFEEQYVFQEKATKELNNSREDEKEHNSDTYVDSDDSLDEKLFPDYDNISVLSHKHMPVPEKFKKSVLIPPVKPDSNTLPVQHLPHNYVIKIFNDWITEDTMKYLLGEKYVYGVKAEHLFQRMTSTEPLAEEKLSSIKNEYIKLCLKLDSLPDETSDISDIELDILDNSNSTIQSTWTNVPENSTKRAFKKRPKRKSNAGKSDRQVTFAPSVKTHSESLVENKLGTVAGKIVEIVDREKEEAGLEKGSKTVSVKGVETALGIGNETVNKMGVEAGKNAETVPKIIEEVHENKIETAEKVDSNTKEQIRQDEEIVQSSVPGPLFPLVDSLSQSSLRKQVLINNLKSIYSGLLPIIGLHYTDIREAVRKFVDTLSLTPTNIIFKPKEWKLICVVLLRVLTSTVLKDIYDELHLIKLCNNPIMPISIDILEIEKIVSEIISVESVIKNQ